MNGKNIIVILSQNGVAVASTYVRSQDIQTNCQTIPKASSTQNKWVERLAGLSEWSIQIGYLVMATTQIRDLLYVGSTFDVTVKDDGNITSITGKAIMTNVHNIASVGNVASGSMTLTGSGALT